MKKNGKSPKIAYINAFILKRNNFKREEGAVSVLVLFTLLMFVVILIGTYALVTANARSQLQSDTRIQELVRKRCRQYR